MSIPSSIEVNGRVYRAPAHPVVVICLDGCEPDYLDAAITASKVPALEHIRRTGTDRLAHCVIPSFTNPNNMSIATGRPPTVHGICGNYLYDTETGREVMMNDVRYLRAPTVFNAFQQAGAKVAIVTAKDKLRALLGAGLNLDDGSACCFSAEKSATSTRIEHGLENAARWLAMDQPDVYSAELSEFVFAAGVKLLAERRPDLMYLTTTDYIQHKHAPGTPDANAFYEMFDRYLGQLNEMGAVIVITADHGMKPKHKPDGTPDVIYAQDLMDELLGKDAARVILPITDPYVVHHGALGSFATAYLPASIDKNELIGKLRRIEGMMLVVDKNEAEQRFDLPGDRIGDIVMISGENVVIGTSADRHDLSALKEPLRSHGGLTEQQIPFIINRKIEIPAEPQLFNYDAFYYATSAAAAVV